MERKGIYFFLFPENWYFVGSQNNGCLRDGRCTINGLRLFLFPNSPSPHIIISLLRRRKEGNSEEVVPSLSCRHWHGVFAPPKKSLATKSNSHLFPLSLIPPTRKNKTLERTLLWQQKANWRNGFASHRPPFFHITIHLIKFFFFSPYLTDPLQPIPRPPPGPNLFRKYPLPDHQKCFSLPAPSPVFLGRGIKFSPSSNFFLFLPS